MSKQFPGGIISKTAPVPSGSFENSTAPGVWTLEQQAYWQKLGQWPTAGNANPNAFIENLFSTNLWNGNDATQTITNGINLSANGGLVWIKSRNATYSYILSDTVRGTGKFLSSNTTDAQGTDANDVTAFNTTGFTVGNNARINNPSFNYVGWTFREQAKFFDIVTYTGDDSVSRQISHNLGSTPGCILVKCTSNTQDWFVNHRSLTGPNYSLNLNLTDAQYASQNWGNAGGTYPTSTNFTVGDNTNVAGRTYVAYLFAHNAGGFGASGTDNVISCGSFSTSGGAATVTLGYEPQWILWKRTDSAQNWNVYDNMRGWAQQQVAQIYPNLTQVEDIYTGSEYFFPTATGFKLNSSFGLSGTYVYVTIRRGPMAVPTVGTSVFYPNAVAQADSPDSSGVPFQPDLINTFSRNGSNRTNKFSYFQFVDRLRGAGAPNNTRVAASEGVGLVSSGTNAEYGQSGSLTYVQLKANSQDITRGTGWNSAAYGDWIYYFLRRAPGFFDVVCYTGDGGYSSYNHNLTVVPEMMIVKARSTTSNWSVYHSALGLGNYVRLNTTAASAGTGDFWYQTPTTTQFSVGGYTEINDTGATYVAYLFATLAGVSKVGSYTGTGAAQTINCGFTTGARFVLIKRYDTTGDWYVWDSARGIIPSNDPYLLLNSTAAETTGTDYVDTTSVGFDITSTAPAAINANGGSYIFLAIA